MAKITEIPKEYKNGFIALSQLDDETFDQLLRLINDASVSFRLRNFASKIETSEKLSSKFIEDIIQSIGNLITVIERNFIPIESAARDIRTVLKLKEIDEEKFCKRVQSLIGCNQLYVSSKAINLVTDYENIFYSAKIISDIRPVFGKDVNMTPRAGIIVHILNIHYGTGEDSEHKDIYLALDEEDISLLQNVLSRAKEKEESLSILMKKSDMQVLKLRD